MRNQTTEPCVKKITKPIAKNKPVNHFLHNNKRLYVHGETVNIACVLHMHFKSSMKLSPPSNLFLSLGEKKYNFLVKNR